MSFPECTRIMYIFIFLRNFHSISRIDLFLTVFLECLLKIDFSSGWVSAKSFRHLWNAVNP